MTSFTAAGEVFIKTETAEVLRLSADDTKTSKNLEATRPENKSIRNALNNTSSGTDHNTSASANADGEQNYQFPTIVVQSAQELATSLSNTESKEVWKLSTGEINEENSLDDAFHKPSSSESIDQTPGSHPQCLIGEKLNTDDEGKREEYSNSHSANLLGYEGGMPQKSDVSQLTSDGEMQNRKRRGRKRLPPLTVSTLTTSSASEFQESTDQPEKGDGRLRKNSQLSIKFGSNLSLRTLGKCYSWMTMNQRIEYFTSILMLKTINKSSPNYLHNRFEYVNDKHQIYTESDANGNLFIPKLSSKTGLRSFQYRGVHAWNSLSVNARDYSQAKILKYM